ncbi:MAG TPA: rhodanese-like domain-containing protein [Thermodesulfobacteriota bacterium]|nr:rhodanese-like domain-containing protein [Thermodesulfobacteriota bacterium]
MKRRLILTAIISVVFVAAAFSASPAPDPVPRVTVEELKAMMLGGRDVLMLDLRSSAAYNASKVKIKGAVRIEQARFMDNISGLPKMKKIITYCT